MPEDEAQIRRLAREAEAGIRSMIETRSTVHSFVYGVDAAGREYVIVMLVLPAEVARQHLQALGVIK
jgi:hypothetical protein